MVIWKYQESWETVTYIINDDSGIVQMIYFAYFIKSNNLGSYIFKGKTGTLQYDAVLGLNWPEVQKNKFFLMNIN